MKLPLHIPNALNYAGRETTVRNLKQGFNQALRVRAQMAFLMTQFGAAAAARSKTSTASVNGFRLPGKAWYDQSYAERCLVDADMAKAPERPKPTPEKIAAEKAHKVAVQQNRYPSLTNYEQGKWYASGRPAHERQFFIGCRS
jgi:hypothetical protein